LPTRLEQALACRAAGLQLNFFGAGFELSNDRLGVVLVPLATGTVRASVTGYPSLTGLDEPCALLDAPVSHEFAPGDLALEGERLIALAPEPLAPVLRQGFVLELEPGMAPVLAAWLPRLEEVACRSAEVAACARAHLPDDWTGRESGLQVCADVVAAITLDGVSPSAAIDVARQEHWASSVEPWLEALAQADVARMLDSIRSASRGGEAPPA